MSGSSRSLLLILMFCVSGHFPTAVSVDCAESVQGTLTFLSQQEGAAVTVVSTVRLPSTNAHATGQSFEEDELTASFVSRLHHARTVTNSEWTANLLDGSVVVVFRNSTVVHLPLDSEYCGPYRVFQHAPNSSAFVMCSNMSRVMKMDPMPDGFRLQTTPVQAQEGKKYLDVPGVPLYNSDPDFRTSAAFINFGETNTGYNKTWLTLVPKLEMEIDSHSYTICDDTYYTTAEWSSCDNEFARIIRFNDTHFLLECRATSDGAASRFLVEAFFKADCEGIRNNLDIPSGGELYVGPDTLAVNFGNSVAVRINDFTVAHHCVITEGLVQRVDFVSTASKGVLLILFTSHGVLTCNNSGVVESLSSSPLLDVAYPYVLHSNYLFLVKEVTSTDLYQISIFDMEKGCEVQYPNAGPIYMDKKPILFVFSPKALNPTTTLPPTQAVSFVSSPEKLNPTNTFELTVTAAVATPSSSLLTIQSSPSATADITIILLFVVPGVLLMFLIASMIAVTVLCFNCRRVRKSWPSVKDSNASRLDSVSSSSTVSELPIPETQQPAVITIRPIPESQRSPYAVPIPESQESNNSLPIQAETEILQGTRAQLV